ncbi:UNVERIFIED_CONTAM: ADP-ribosylation factor 1 [Sesamum calycinum]|uniref:ADP-ribosylation factor 1 n=1 Tax=Sesamum calycinum TaxID=2727403 RepID=A0AAW2LTQ1_9LAMI
MGQALRKLFDTLFGNTEMRVVMLGLDAAGKTTILYKLHIGEVLSTVPTIVVNGLGAHVCLRLNIKMMKVIAAMQIYVVDSLDRERIAMAKKEFQAIIRDPFMKNAIILVFANKQDLRGAMTPMEICDGLGLNDLKDRKWHIERTCAIKGEGLYEGLDWLSNTLKEQRAIGFSSVANMRMVQSVNWKA